MGVWTPGPLICLFAGLFAAADVAKMPSGLDRETSADLAALLAKARAAGFPSGFIAVGAGYRPSADQHRLADAVAKTFGAEELGRWIAAHSQHLTRRSVDFSFEVPSTIANGERGGIAHLSSYRWLQQHAHEFGFEQTFPQQPWHFTHAPPTATDAGATVAGSMRAPRGSGAIDRVLGGSVIAWLPATSEIVYLQCWREEGGGDGCALRWEGRRDGKITRTVPISSPGDANTDEARRLRSVPPPKAVAALPDDAILLTVQTRLMGQSTVKIAAGQPLVWNAAASTLSLDGKVTNQVKQLAPWIGTPDDVYTNPDLDFAVVEVVYDPQGAFTDGANLVRRFEVIEGVALGLGRHWRKGLPAAVVDFVERYAGCNHWGGEDGYDDQRRKEIERNVVQLGCERLEADEGRLRKKYAGKSRILAAIAAASQYEGD